MGNLKIYFLFALVFLGVLSAFASDPTFENQFSPEVICDESITEPRTECWCTLVQPSYIDWGCVAACEVGCLLCGADTVCYSLFSAYCIAQCTYPEQCIGEYECVTIYPCSWYAQPLVINSNAYCYRKFLDLTLLIIR
jgi:hypothetical protein